jgi:hypothetical protein
MVNPQTWNRYAYVANMPLNGVDCFGLLGGGSDVVGSARRAGMGYNYSDLSLLLREADSMQPQKYIGGRPARSTGCYNN